MWQTLLFSIVGDIIGKATPAVRTEMEKAIDTLQTMVDGTPNPYDNMLLDMLKKLLRMEDNADTRD